MNKLILGGCLEILPTLEDNSIDLVLSDLPYGVTKNKWDEIIPLEPLWKELIRVAKENTAFIFHATQPFASTLIVSNPNMFRYDIIWEKNSPTGHLNANRMPMRSHESILIFYKKLPTYNPQKTLGDKPSHSKGNKGIGKVVESDNNYNGYDLLDKSKEHGNWKFPTSVWRVDRVPPSKILHPTQKPLELVQRLIKTYSNKGQVVLDVTAGVFTTAVGCIKEGRDYICIEKEEEYYRIGKERIRYEVI